jgi:hypothetical protein
MRKVRRQLATDFSDTMNKTLGEVPFPEMPAQMTGDSVPEFLADFFMNPLIAEHHNKRREGTMKNNTPLRRCVFETPRRQMRAVPLSPRCPRKKGATDTTISPDVCSSACSMACLTFTESIELSNCFRVITMSRSRLHRRTILRRR